MKLRLLQIMILLGLAATSALASPYISITPPTQTSIAPGTTVGWGFSIHPDDNYYLVVDTVFLTESTALGVYTDFLELYLPFAPSSPDQYVPFNLVGNSGVGQYVVDPAAAPSSTDNIQFNISYELDPCDLSVSSCAAVQSGLLLTDQSNATPAVTIQTADSSTPSEVAPEPGTMFTIGLAGVLLALLRTTVERGRTRSGACSKSCSWAGYPILSNTYLGRLVAFLCTWETKPGTR